MRYSLLVLIVWGYNDGRDSRLDHSRNALAVGYAGEALLEDLNFELKRGEIKMIAGASGCGKSTYCVT